MGVFTKTQELVTLSMLLMKILAVGYIAMAVTQSLSGVMRGAGDTITPMRISIISTIIIRVPLAYGLAYLTTLYAIPKWKTGGRLHFFVMLLGTWCLNYRMVLSEREVETTGNLNEFLPFSVFLCQNLQEIIVIKEKKGYNRAEQNYEVE